MQFGVLLADVPGSMPPRAHLERLLRQVNAAQRNGFTLLALGQHFLYGDVRWLQPVPTIARLAGEVDAGVRFATFVLVAPLHQPVVLAEELATLDIVTGGRLDIGLGMGYRREEFHQLGVPFGERISRFEECVELLRALWTDDRVTHHGRHWQLDGATPHLTPVQQPAPPIWIGANSEVGIRRAARLGDAWPCGPRMPVDEIEQSLAVFASERAALGLAPVLRHPIRREVVLGRDRDDARARFTAMTADRFRAYAERERLSLPGSTAPGEEASTAMLGSGADVVAQLRELDARLSIGTVIVRVDWPGMSPEEVLAQLDDLGEHVVRPLAEHP